MKKQIFSKENTGSIKGKLVALVFFLIAIGGLILFINSFSSEKETESDNKSAQTAVDSNKIKKEDSSRFYGKFEDYSIDSESTNKAKLKNKNKKLRPKQERSNYSSFVWKTVIIIVVLLIVLIVYIYYRKNYTKAGNASNQINIIGKSYIGKNQYLLIVECGGTKMLLGVTEHNINLLKEFDKDETDIEIESQETKNNDQGGFGNILNNLK